MGTYRPQDRRYTYEDSWEAFTAKIAAYPPKADAPGPRGSRGIRWGRSSGVAHAPGRGSHAARSHERSGRCTSPPRRRGAAGAVYERRPYVMSIRPTRSASLSRAFGRRDASRGASCSGSAGRAGCGGWVVRVDDMVRFLTGSDSVPLVAAGGESTTSGSRVESDES